MKTSGYPKNISEHFDRKYGKEGSASRKAFEERAENHYIAEMIKEGRKKAKLTQVELADKIATKRTYISRIERAASDIRLSTLKRIIEEGLGGRLDIKIDFKR